jgi:hypothetical protein
VGLICLAIRSRLQNVYTSFSRSITFSSEISRSDIKPANPSGNELHRWGEGGKKLATIKTSQPSFAVTLGGPDMKLALVITAPGSGDHTLTNGKIEAVQTDVAGTGSP